MEKSFYSKCTSVSIRLKHIESRHAQLTSDHSERKPDYQTI